MGKIVASSRQMGATGKRETACTVVFMQPSIGANPLYSSTDVDACWWFATYRECTATHLHHKRKCKGRNRRNSCGLCPGDRGAWPGWSSLTGHKWSTLSGHRGEYTETIADGVQVFHNPNARHPLSPEVFRRSGVVQHYFDLLAGEWVYEEVDNCLHVRSVMLVGSAESFPGVFAPTKS